MTSKAQEVIDRVEKIAKRQGELFEELKVSLLIAEIWPEAFKNGTLSSHLTGSYNHPKNIEIHLSNDKCSKTYKLGELPWRVIEPHFQFLLKGSPQEIQTFKKIRAHHEKEFNRE